MLISTFTAVSLFNSLSKGQTSRMWILCSFPLVSLKHLPSSLALSFFPSRSSSHLFFLCSSLTPSVCFLWSPVEVEKVNVSFSTITLLIVLSSLLFSDFFLFSRFCSCRFGFVIHPSQPSYVLKSPLSWWWQFICTLFILCNFKFKKERFTYLT